MRASRGGAIQAVDPDGLVEWARAHRAELVLPHRVGNFVHTGGELVRVYGGEFGDRAAEELEGMIALGDERTFDQDPAFALRMMVDIANRALSPAVNDPTTAVQVLDHIGEVLGLIGRTDLEKRTKPASADTPAAVVMVDSPLGGLRHARTHGDPRVRCNVGADHATTPSTARGASRDGTARAPSRGRRRAPPSRCHRRRRLARLGRPRSRGRGRPPGDRRPRAHLVEPSRDRAAARRDGARPRQAPTGAKRRPRRAAGEGVIRRSETAPQNAQSIASMLPTRPGRR